MRRYSITSWILYVVCLSLLPLAINAVLFYFADKSIYDEHFIFMGELFFFTLMMSADTLKNISCNKMHELSRTLHVVIFFAAIILIVFASLLYGLVTAKNVSALNWSFNPMKLKFSSIMISIGSLSIGIVVQIWQATKKGDETNE